MERKVAICAWRFIEVIIIFAFSLGGLFAGWFTPTEAGAIGAIGVLVIAIVEKEMSWEKLKMALFKTSQTAAMIMLLVAGASVFSHFLALSQVSFILQPGRLQHLPRHGWLLL